MLNEAESWAGCGGSSGCGGFKETSLSEVAHDERDGYQSGADADRSEELVEGVGQEERAGSRRHFRANDGLAEAQLAQHGRHIDPTGEKDDSSKVVRSARNLHIRQSLTFTSSISFFFFATAH